MADDFDAGICSGSWWNATNISSSRGSFHASAMGAAVVSCSSAVDTDTSGSSGGAAFSWLSTADVEPGSSASAPLDDAASILPGSSFGGLSHAPPINWNNQTLLHSSSERETSCFHSMLQEEPLSYDHQFDMSPQEINQQKQFLMQQQQQSGLFPVMLQGLYNMEPKPQQQSVYDQRSTLSYQQQPGSSSLVSPTNPLLNSSTPKQQQLNSSISTNHLQFSNNAPFWNPSAAAIGEAKSDIYPSLAPLQQFVTRRFEQKPNCSSITTTKSSTDSATKKSSSDSSSEASLKKPRIDKPSPLPAFKVRKEKLGDRITALQQLVSPFGKTDTASVLHEAIEYIKFLHDQVNMLSTPYLKNGNPMQHQQSSSNSMDGEDTKQDLRSRGLCLVPMESIFPVARETMADFWTPTFGGTYR
ncbi:transcription factor bHLH112-like isoform X1 [Iris pallida]|uniref:Transcription factor bHLH112-like isoform X1 n=1 Tax=Iris pallida TaxID=29817 RepID=A0AAX6H492_IRIPA|nr:transcription factor bHLH112-like isoform X1 [Iris pallida]KAJ6843642.1 transcription factor bHLH112-like isoform X1 [Iris pallida]